MFALAEAIYAAETDSLSEFNISGVELLARHLGLGCKFAKSSVLAIGGASTERLVAICRHFGASRYVTGHGALNYLDHEAFELEGVHVEYMDYRKSAYPQLHGEFTPFVTMLDTIAHCGAGARALVQSGTVGWKDIVHRAGG